MQREKMNNFRRSVLENLGWLQFVIVIKVIVIESNLYLGAENVIVIVIDYFVNVIMFTITLWLFCDYVMIFL